MLPSRARWDVSRADEETVRELAAGLRVHPTLARLLAARGIRTVGEAEQFMHAGTDHLYDPFLLDGMRAGVDRIRAALARGEKIRIYGDYDADGVSSTALMIQLLRQLDASFDYYIPHRVAEGYGLNRNALDLAKAEGVGLIVTVDTGISAREQVAYAAELGIDTVVTDHHEPPELLPEACAVINPKKPGCPYPYKQLAGAGVAFKLAQALLGRIPEELLEIAAIGTIADLMPLTGENRALVRLGLERMRSTRNPGIKALLDVAGIDRADVTATHIGFALAPRINASGRLESAGDAVRLLTAASREEAEQVAAALDALNKERQRIVDEIAREALTMAASAVAADRDKALVLAEDNWNVGVIGIVASKVLEKFYRPTIILSIDPETGMAKGSARSIPGFDIHKALSRCSDLLDHFGGHQAAAGMTLRADKIADLRERLNGLAGEWLTEEDLMPLLKADSLCDLSEDPLNWLGQLEKLAPFGMGNPVPRFMFTGLRVKDKKTMGKDNRHMKLVLQQEGSAAGCVLDAVGFGRGALAGRISSTARVDVLGELSINEWNGNKKAQLMIQDIRVPQTQVFDWRGIRETDARWTGLAEQFQAQPSAAAVFLVGSEEEAAHVKELAARVAADIWLAGPFGDVKPYMEQTQTAGLSAASDLILYSLPDSLQRLSAVLASAAGAERIFAVFRERTAARWSLPTREMFKQVYAVIRKDGENAGEDAIVYFSKRSGLSAAMVKFIMEVFEELAFVEKAAGGYRCLASPGKKDLTESREYQRRQNLQEAELLLQFSSAAELSDWILAQRNDEKKATEVNR